MPHLSWEGWDEFNLAAYALRSVILWKRINAKRVKAASIIRDDGTVDRAELHRSMDVARIESDLRSFRFRIARSRQCAHPALP
jgi:hypothetical protein